MLIHQKQNPKCGKALYEVPALAAATLPSAIEKDDECQDETPLDNSIWRGLKWGFIGCSAKQGSQNCLGVLEG